MPGKTHQAELRKPSRSIFGGTIVRRIPLAAYFTDASFLIDLIRWKWIRIAMFVCGNDCGRQSPKRYLGRSQFCPNTGRVSRISHTWITKGKIKNCTGLITFQR
jgi:hypothetical protein